MAINFYDTNVLHFINTKAIFVHFLLLECPSVNKLLAYSFVFFWGGGVGERLFFSQALKPVVFTSVN